MSAGAYFRSLDHLAGANHLVEEAKAEFPSYDPSEMVKGGKSSRRSFMKLAGASMALAGITLTGCRRWPEEELVPYSSAPRDRIPGLPQHYASAFELGGVADGVLVTTYDGRPIKVEGNPDHPFAIAFNGLGNTGAGRYGASTKFAQASVLELYDPERVRGVYSGPVIDRKPSSIEEFVAAAKAALSGGRVAILSTPTSSMSVAAAWQSLSKAYPTAKWYEYEPLNDDAAREGGTLAFGRPVRAVLDLVKADVVVSLDDDILGSHPAHLRYSADWAERRRRAETDKTMNRVFIAESIYSNTGAAADDRVGVKPSRIDIVARALAAALGVAGASAGELTETEKAFVTHAAEALKAAGKNGVVTVGSHLPAQTQAVAHLINAQLGVIGTTVRYLELPAKPSQVASIKQLADDLKSGAVAGLIVLGGNPMYDAPADLGLADLVRNASFSAYLGLFVNETSVVCNWHVPEAHFLESWGDARAFDGTVSLMQPMIEPLFGGKTKAELLALLAGESEASGRAIARRVSGLTDEVAYKKALQKGVIEGTAYRTANVTAGSFPAAAPAGDASGFEFRFVSSNVFDGRYTNNGWLVELPDSLTKLTWDNAALISKKDAETLGVTNGDYLDLTVSGRSLKIPAFILPGQPIGSIQLPLGWGREAAGEIGTGIGFNTYTLRITTGFNIASGTAAKGSGSYRLASTQEHYLTDWVGNKLYQKRIGKPFEEGKLIHESTLTVFKENPEAMHGHKHKGLALQLFDPPHPLTDAHAWGMAIDMSSCTGCGACVVACQAENNIPTVGKHQVLMQRAMHWIRIDRYFKHDPEADPDITNPQMVFQPMMCVHCENAPCEQVCPVAATVHDTEGLNTMVYNRCIGTRYCSNNCPYKVRRFNYFDYQSTSPRDGYRMPWPKMPDQQQREAIDPLKKLMFNPDVTVRMRGVMEKCTYCTQRIQNAKIDVRNEFQQGKRPTDKVPDGMVLTACQQACPTQAIWFGDINDAGSRVVQWQKSPRSYDLLEELNTRPRTKYLGKLRNPAVEPVKTAAEGHH